MKVYKNQYGWSTLCKSKKIDGSEIKVYMSLSFWNCAEPIEEEATIEVNSFFMGCYQNKNGVVMPKMIVTNWSTNVELKQDKEPKQEPKAVQQSAFERYNEELPF